MKHIIMINDGDDNGSQVNDINTTNTNRNNHFTSCHIVQFTRKRFKCVNKQNTFLEKNKYQFNYFKYYEYKNKQVHESHGLS